MDFISTRQLNKYDEILEEINREFEKSEQLKKEIEKANDKIITLKLGASCKQKISHVNIKIFNNVSEIYNLYDSDVAHCDLQALSQHLDCKFYLIEVILTECLLSKLLDLEWKLQIRINLDAFSTCKVIKLTNKTPVMEIIPVNSNIRECTVESCLFLQSESDWSIIDLHSVKVDVSYYFQSFKEHNASRDFSKDMLNITKLYNSSSNLLCVQSQLEIQNQFKCNGDENDLVSNIVRNSYHILDLELFSEFSNESKNIVDIQFCAGDKRLIILYNKGSNVLKAKCCSSEMLHIKKFFINHSVCDHSKFKKKLKDIVSKKHSLEDASLYELFSLHQEMRKLWT